MISCRITNSQTILPEIEAEAGGHPLVADHQEPVEVVQGKDRIGRIAQFEAHINQGDLDDLGTVRPVCLFKGDKGFETDFGDVVVVEIETDDDITEGGESASVEAQEDWCCRSWPGIDQQASVTEFIDISKAGFEVDDRRRAGRSGAAGCRYTGTIDIDPEFIGLHDDTRYSNQGDLLCLSP